MFINLKECVEAVEDGQISEGEKNLQVELHDRFTVHGENDPVRPITFMRRFINLNDTTDSVILLTVGDDKAKVFSYRNMELKDVNLRDLGSEERQSKMPQMKDYDFSGMKICNAYIADNSRYFCVGLVQEDLQQSKGSKRDLKSILGIYRICPSSLEISLEMWITQVSHPNYLSLLLKILCLVSLQELLRRRSHDNGDVLVSKWEGARLPLLTVGLRH